MKVSLMIDQEVWQKWTFLTTAGKLPDCRMSLCKGFTQGGSNADVVLVDSYLKNIIDEVDWADGYDAVVSDAEGEGPNISTY